MADGAYRFHQPGAGQFYYPQHNQHNNNNHRNINRATSPQGSRRPFNNDTPSPSRSPVAATSAHNTFNMYNHNGHNGQHVMMNGGQNHQRYGMQMPKYQQHNHHPHHNQTAHHHNQHHQGGHIGHQHNFSSGNLSSATPNLPSYGTNHNQNGVSENMQDDMEEPMNEHWQEQLQLASESRQASSPHHHARTVAQAFRPNFPSSSGAATEEQQVEEVARMKKPSTNAKQHWDALDFGGQGLRALSDALFRYNFLAKLHLNYNKLDHLPAAIGRLKSLTHLDVSSNQLVELPEEVGMLTNLQKLLLFDNQIQSLPYELGFLYNLEVLGIQGNPLDEDLKTKLMHEGTKQLIVYLRENMPDQEPPTERDWIVLDETTNVAAQADRFTALNYNILCERYATRSMYGYVPDRILNWDFRKELILNEIREHSADIVCLQELDKYSFDEFFRTKLSYNGYKGVHAQKTRAETLGDNAKFVDGCGTFWKEKKYICLDSQHMVFGRKAVERAGAKASADMLNRVWQRDDIALVTLLENRITGSRLIVVNTHIFWDPSFKDVKLIQVAVMMEELAKIAEKYAKMPPCTNKNLFRFSDADDGNEPLPEPGPSLEYSSGSEIPMIICCDLNSDARSAIYDLLAHGGIKSQHSDLDERNYGAFSDAGMSHPFTLKSAYASIGELSFTNYTPNFCGALDYIWYSSNALRVTGLLGEVDKEYLQRVPGFPNFHFPSDHLALLAEFSVSSKKANKVVEADFGPQRDRR